jgi:hypothetical protein
MLKQPLTLVLRTAVVCCVGSCAVKCPGALIEVQLAGYISRADAVGDTGIELGDRFSGIFRYDTRTPLRESLTGQARYGGPWSESIPVFEIDIRQVAFSPHQAVNVLLRVVNDQDLSFPDDPDAPEKVDAFHYGARSDALAGTISLGNSNLDSMVDTMIPESFDLSVWQTAQLSLISPNTPLVRADGSYVFPGEELLLLGVIDKMTVIPEPSTVVLLLITLPLVWQIAFQRRRTQSGTNSC